MEIFELKEDKIIKKWLSGRRATEETRKSYIQSMRDYTEYTKKAPEELLLEAENEIRAGLLMRERNIDSDLLGFREKLEERKLAPLTIRSRMTGVCSFYTHFNIPLPTLPRSTQNARPELKRREIPTKDDIRNILQHCDSLERALILVQLFPF
jgi:integrase